MTTRSMLGVFALCALVHCSVPQGPGPLTSDSLAVALFVDLHLAHARQELELYTPGRDTILARHGLDSTSFAALMDYYARHPEAYVDLYAQVVDRLESQQMRRLR